MRTFVLGGGSSRGALQIGALEVLFENDVKPEMVIGSSIGGINAAFIANEPTAEGLAALKELYLSAGSEIFQGNKASALMKLVSGDRYLFDNDKLRQLVEENLGDKRFGDLQLPCYVVGSDLNTAEMYVFGNDADERVLDALMSTSAMIPVYPPWRCNATLYGDGGLTANLPLEQAIERGATQLVAFNLTNQLRPEKQRETVVDMFLHNLDLLLHGQVQATIAIAQARDDVQLTVLNLTTDEYVEFTDLDRMEELFARGREVAEEMLPELTDALDEEAEEG